jgi:hypothetical protein
MCATISAFQQGQGSLGTSIICPYNLSLSIINYSKPFISTSSQLLESDLYLGTQLVKNGCTYCKKYEIWISMDLHVKWFNWSMSFPKKLQNLVKPLDLLHVNFPVCSFHLHVKFTYFNFLTQIFGFFSSKDWNTTTEELSPQHSKRVGSYRQFQSRWTNSPKSPCNSMGPAYFDVGTPVFVMHTLDSTYI